MLILSFQTKPHALILGYVNFKELEAWCGLKASQILFLPSSPTGLQLSARDKDMPLLLKLLFLSLAVGDCYLVYAKYTNRLNSKLSESIRRLTWHEHLEA